MNNKKPINTMLVLIVVLVLTGFTYAEAADLPVTSSFGWRIHPIRGDWQFHTGLDLGYEYGTGIPALMDGQVVAAGDYGDGYGKQIAIYHAQYDTYTKYCHLSDIYVSYGSQVGQGQLIGAVGSSGYSTGPHLHIEYIAMNTATGQYEYQDPMQLWGW